METVVAQICAETLGVDYRRIRVVHGRTDQIASGAGTFASRVTVMTGSATKIAAEKVCLKATEMAATLLQLPQDALTVVDGCVVQAANVNGPSVTLAEVARALSPVSPLLAGREPGLTADGWFFSSHMTYPYGMHLAMVRIDRGTGGIIVERYAIAYEIGRAVNPMLVEGQIVGGLAQGIGGALFEEFRYDGNGEPLSVTFADYLLPTMAEMPFDVDVQIFEDAPSPLNPLGLRGAGEGGTNAAGAAIAAAIDSALDNTGSVTRLPVTPARIKALLLGTDEAESLA